MLKAVVFVPLGCGAWLYVGRGGKEELSSFVELEYALSVYYYSRATFWVATQKQVFYITKIYEVSF